MIFMKSLEEFNKTSAFLAFGHLALSRSKSIETLDISMVV
jgi:hypothetical protein